MRAGFKRVAVIKLAFAVRRPPNGSDIGRFSRLGAGRVARIFSGRRELNIEELSPLLYRLVGGVVCGMRWNYIFLFFPPFWEFKDRDGNMLLCKKKENNSISSRIELFFFLFLENLKIVMEISIYVSCSNLVGWSFKIIQFLKLKIWNFH